MTGSTFWSHLEEYNSVTVTLKLSCRPEREHTSHRFLCTASLSSSESLFKTLLLVYEALNSLGTTDLSDLILYDMNPQGRSGFLAF